jgi:hypothetical protein
MPAQARKFRAGPGWAAHAQKYPYDGYLVICAAVAAVVLIVLSYYADPVTGKKL